MTKTQVEVITSVQRRRRWSRTEKERIVAAALEPGAVASDVARAAGIHASQLFRWRQQLCEPGPDRSAAATAPAFAAVTVATDLAATAAAQIPALPTPASDGVVEIEFAGGTRLRISGAVDPAMASALITALVRAPRRPRR
ncbi:IS66-like element accessory protein TnpA [Rhodoplanes sp. SY1]|uniref:IS66-like element accessory protein TnpA n=1 Tax=Rhodoplanes sp. SY1 TaxID=3166646 RepID=UPI0038B5B8A3